MSAHPTEPEERSNPWVFGAAFFFGWCVIAYGLWTMFANKGLTNPTYSFKLAFGANILHDAIFAPAVFVTGYVIGRITPAWLRGPLMWALYASVVTLLVAYVPLRGFGKKDDNPSLLPLDYVTGTLTVLAVIWAIAVMLAGVRFFRRNTSTPVAGPPAGLSE